MVKNICLVYRRSLMFCDHISCNGGLFYVVGIIVKYRDCFQAQNMNHKLGWTLDVIMTI